jgi:hypothetical protein
MTLNRDGFISSVSAQLTSNNLAAVIAAMTLGRDILPSLVPVSTLWGALDDP